MVVAAAAAQDTRYFAAPSFDATLPWCFLNACCCSSDDYVSAEVFDCRVTPDCC